MAHTKSAGSTRLGRDSASKRLGLKISDGQGVKAGYILIRQRGLKFHPGIHVRRGGDDSLYALQDGILKFTTKKKRMFNGKIREVKIVNVIDA